MKVRGHRSRAARRALVVLTGLSLATGVGVAAGAADPDIPGHARPVAATAAPDGTVTLPTGDRYSIHHDGSGHTLVTPAADSSRSYVTMRVAGDDYVVPDAAFGTPGGIDPSRYDVSKTLRGGKAPATTHPDSPLRAVTFNVLDGQGKPATNGLIAVVNVDDSSQYEGAPEITDGVAKASLPDGHYAILQYDGSYDSDGAPVAMRIGFVDFTVAGGPATVTVDGVRGATHQVTFGATPKPADQTYHSVAIFRGSSRQAYLGMGAETTVGTPIYLASTGSPIGIQHLENQASFTSPDGAAQPYNYELLFQRDGAIGADQQYPISASKLAALHMRYHADAAGTTGSASVETMTPYAENLGVGVDPVTLPLKRTTYVTADPDVYAVGYLENDSTGETMASGMHSYRPGSDLTIDWNDGPDAPTLPADTGTGHYHCLACRIGDTLSLSPSPLGDSTPDHDSYDAPRGNASTAHIQLYRGSTKLADAAGANGARVTVGPDTADYRLVLDNDRTGAVLSTRSHTEWTFRSGHSGATTVPSRWDCDTNGNTTGCSALDLLAPHYQLAQSMTGTVPTGPQTLTMTVGHSTNQDAPAVSGATVSISYDGGTTWAPAAVGAAGRDSYVARWTNASTTAGKHISLRITAKDADGNTVTQTITDAVTVAAT